MSAFNTPYSLALSSKALSPFNQHEPPAFPDCRGSRGLSTPQERYLRLIDPRNQPIVLLIRGASLFIGAQNRGVQNLFLGRVFNSIQMKRICAKNDVHESAYCKEPRENKTI